MGSSATATGDEQELSDKWKKLEGIFMPYARVMRDQFFEKSADDDVRFIHYTSAETAIKIIEQKRLWMRSPACMSDFVEVQHGFLILKKFFEDKSKSERFREVVNSIEDGAADKAIKQFDLWWTTGILLYKSYVLSISEHPQSERAHGRLSMWRAYGGTEGKVGLILKIPRRSKVAEAMHLTFSPVFYLTVEQADTLLPTIIANIEMHKAYLKGLKPGEFFGWIMQMFMINVTCIKHPCFNEEKEWRAVHNPALFPQPSIPPKVVTINGIPQTIYELPIDKDELDFKNLYAGLLIGPSQYPGVMHEVFNRALTAAGVSAADTKVSYSNVPLRT